MNSAYNPKDFFPINFLFIVLLCCVFAEEDYLFSVNLANILCKQRDYFKETKKTPAPAQRIFNDQESKWWMKWKKCDKSPSCSPFHFKTDGIDFKKIEVDASELAKAKIGSSPKRTENTRQAHPCLRECSTDPSTAKICSYTFDVKYWFSSGWQCGRCPNVKAHCTAGNCIALDGTLRPLIVVDHKIPGPSIRVCEGDTVVVDVENLLVTEGVTIHWHGILQKNTPWMDGVPGVTQCQIAPETTFRYVFDVPVGGTYFWHSSTGYHRGDGAFGPLIVRKARSKDPHAKRYDFDLPAHEISIADFAPEFGISHALNFEYSVGDNQPRVILINGKGLPSNFFDGFSDADTLQSKGKLFVPIQEFRVVKGKSYRMRAISNGVANCPVEMTVENHTMEVIAGDGHDIEVVKVKSIVFYAGDRWDFVLHANQPVASYWMKFRGLAHCSNTSKSLYQVAVLNYEGIKPETFPRHSIKNWQSAGDTTNGVKLNPYAIPPGTPGNNIHYTALKSIVDDDPEILTQAVADYQFHLGFRFNPISSRHVTRRMVSQSGINTRRAGTQLFLPQFNFLTHKFLPAPPLTQPEVLNSEKICGYNYHMSHNCSQGNFCFCTHLLKVKLNSIVEMVLIDYGFPTDVSHPIHLHGFSFRVMSVQKVNSSITVDMFKALDSQNKVNRTRRNAPIMDNVAVPDGGYTIIRFRADNPGFWLLRCHLEMHAQTGLSLILQVGELEEMPKAPSNFPRCTSFQGPELKFINNCVEPEPPSGVKP